jgi:hypothetical protein
MILVVAVIFEKMEPPELDRRPTDHEKYGRVLTLHSLHKQVPDINNLGKPAVAQTATPGFFKGWVLAQVS